MDWSEMAIVRPRESSPVRSVEVCQGVRCPLVPLVLPHGIVGKPSTVVGLGRIVATQHHRAIARASQICYHE